AVCQCGRERPPGRQQWRQKGKQGQRGAPLTRQSCNGGVATADRRRRRQVAIRELGALISKKAIEQSSISSCQTRTCHASTEDISGIMRTEVNPRERHQ